MPVKSADKRKSQAAKLVQGREKKSREGNLDRDLKEQYFIIRKDIMKLRDDLARGYDMAREWVDKKGKVRNLLKAK